MNKNLKLLFLIVAILIIGVAIFQKNQVISPDIVEETPETKPVKKAVTEVEVKSPEAANEAQVVSGESAKEYEEAMEALPTVDDIKKLSEEEVHHSPVAVKDGGLLIGEIHEAAQKDPARREGTLKFFKSCAENSELLPAIRAVCWKKTLSQIVEWKIFLPIADADVPEEIKALAMRLP
ncbi:MAG: hypothetical protein NDI69_12725 [Bacteriovoracaceae bacterium]|nr:hypothetical protein [Bacteriovoracaceae bacterium]